MDFTPASQNGIIPPSETGTLSSKLGLAASSTSTIYGNELILKAISDAAMYKTVPATFYKKSGSTVTSIGTGTWINTNTCVLVTSGISTGTYQIYTVWPGEGMYGPQSTETVPLDYSVIAGYPLNATITNSVSPSSGNLVVGEGTATISVSVSTSTVLVDTLSFYVGNTFYGQAPFINNVATLSISNLPAGVNTIKTIWPGATIGGKPYEGFTYEFSYEILAGTDLTVPLVLTVSPSNQVVGEGDISLSASLSTSTSISTGTVTFKSDGVSIASVKMTSNVSSVTIPNSLTVGSHTIEATYDGNSTSHPRYLPITSTTSTFTVKARETINNITVNISPNPSVFDFEDVTFNAIINAPSSVPGTLYFYSNGNQIGSSAIIGNQASLTLPAFDVGTYTITSHYPGSIVAPKYYEFTSTDVTYESISAYNYPGTMTLTGPSNAHQLGSDILTLTGSVNTLTGGVATLYQFTTIYSTGTSSTSSIKTIAYNNSIPPTNKTTSTVINSTGTTNVTNPITLSTETYTSTIVTTITTATTYSGTKQSTVTWNATEISSYNGGSSGNYSIAWNPTTKYPSGLTFTLNGVVRTVSTTAGTGQPGQPWRVYFKPAYGAAGTDYTGNFSLIYPTYVSTATEITTTETNTTYVSALDYDPITSELFTGTNSLQFIVDPKILVGTEYFKAVWAGQGILGPGYTPYFGTASNVLTQTIIPAQISVSASTLTNSIAIANTFTVTLNTSSHIGNIVRLYNGTTELSSSTIATNSSTTTFTIPAGTIPLGSNSIKAILTASSVTAESSPITVNILPTSETISTISLSTSSFQYYNNNGTTNTSLITATVFVSSTNTEHSLQGTYSLFGNNTLITSTNVTTSSVNIEFNPSLYTTVNQSLDVKVVYNGDGWNQTSTATTILLITKINAIVTATTTNLITEGSASGSYNGPVYLTATFENTSTAPSSVNWLQNGNFVVATPVVNGVAYLNNITVPLGTTYFSINYSENSVYSGLSNSYPINQVDYRYDGIITTVTNWIAYPGVAGGPGGTFKVQFNTSYTPEPHGLVPSTFLGAPNSWFERIYPVATYSWSYKKQGSSTVYYTTSTVQHGQDYGDEVFLTTSNPKITFAPLPFYGTNPGFTVTNLTLLSVTDAYVYTINNGIVNGQESNRITGSKA